MVSVGAGRNGGRVLTRRGGMSHRRDPLAWGESPNWTPRGRRFRLACRAWSIFFVNERMKRRTPSKPGPRTGTSARGEPSLAQGLIHEILRLSLLLRRISEPRFAGFGMSTTQWAILRTLARLEQQGQPSPRVHELSHALLIQPPSLSATLDRMERAGLLQRIMDPDDHRTRRVQLRPDGREMLERALVGHAAWQSQLMAGLGTGEQRAVRAKLATLRAHLEGLERGSGSESASMGESSELTTRLHVRPAKKRGASKRKAP